MINLLYFRDLRRNWSKDKIMSRSYKKHIIFKCKNQKFFKHLSNKKIRRNFEIPSGMAFKKVHCSYDICDYSSIIVGENAKNRILDLGIPEHHMRMK